VLNPCKCDENGITCDGNNALNLKHVFENIDHNLGQNEKHFKKFFLSNKAITEIEENTFFEVTFDEIFIDRAANLKSINSHAFNSTNSVTKRFTLWDAPIVNSPPNYDIFVMLSSFINLEGVILIGTQISEIPSYAFRPINGIQSKLSMIYFGENKIEKIGNYCFYDLENLKYLFLRNNPLKLISMNSFNFRNVSNQTFLLDLTFINTLNGSSFAINSLSDINRPTIIFLESDPNLKFFDETIFLPFFESNPENKIISTDGIRLLDCDDCRSHWLVKESKYLKRLNKIECLNGKDITNSNNFKNCNH
jgi:hypothetical protein